MPYAPDVATEACTECGFVWADVPSAAVAERIRAATATLADLLVGRPDAAARRSAPDRWSPVEYGCHVRDVLLNLRDRIVLGAVEDTPVPHGMHGTPRVELGLYALDDAATTAADLRFAGGLFARTWSALPTDLVDRPIVYGWPVVATRDLRWVAAQALHECEHHLADVRADLGEEGRAPTTRR